MASEPLTLLDPGPRESVAFRWSTYDVPFWVRENSRAGRWNYAEDPPTQYWSLAPEAAWAELIRHENLRSEDELEMVRVPLWVCRVRGALLLDLRDDENQQRYSISEEELVDDDWEPCQRLAATLRQEYDGVVSPCAALPSEANLTLFGARRAIDWSSKPALASTVPTTQAAIGRPPHALLGRVRRRVPSPSDRLF